MNRNLSDPKRAYVVWTLIAINVLIFFVLEASGSTENAYYLFRHGAMLTSAITEDHEYWRFFTAMFLHFGADHIFNNMLVLFAVGTILENGIGHTRMAAIYLLSGLGANLVSHLVRVRAGEEVLSAGASGAVFGLIGAMIFAGIFARELTGALSARQIIILLILSLYHGVSEAVDDTAHLSGLVFGFLLAALLLKLFPPKKTNPGTGSDRWETAAQAPETAGDFSTETDRRKDGDNQWK